MKNKTILLNKYLLKLLIKNNFLKLTTIISIIKL